MDLAEETYIYPSFNSLDFMLNEIDHDSWRPLPEEREERVTAVKLMKTVVQLKLEMEFKRIQQEAEAEHLSETKRKKLSFRRRINHKEAAKLVENLSGHCGICFEKADTRVVHNGEEGDETKYDWCKYPICWKCLYKCMANQLDHTDNIIYPKCPGCNQRICYRVTRGKSNRKHAVRLRKFHKDHMPKFERRVIKYKPRKNFKPKKEHL